MGEVDYSNFYIMWREEKIAEVDFSPEEFKIGIISDSKKNPFYKSNKTLGRREVMQFVREQLLDNHNADSKQILEQMGLRNYDMWTIARKTNATSWRNSYWLLFKGQDLKYKDIVERVPSLESV